MIYGARGDYECSSVLDIFRLARRHGVEIDIRHDKDLHAFKVTFIKDGYKLTRLFADLDGTPATSAELVWDMMNYYIRELNFEVERNKNYIAYLDDDRDSSGLLEE